MAFFFFFYLLITDTKMCNEMTVKEIVLDSGKQAWY